jgi:hypothetical protein
MQRRIVGKYPGRNAKALRRPSQIITQPRQNSIDVTMRQATRVSRLIWQSSPPDRMARGSGQI